MRRKLFCTLLAVMAALFFMDMAGMTLRPDQLQGYTGSSRRYIADVEKVQYKDEESWYLEAKIISADGRRVKIQEKVLLSYYENLEKPWELLHSRIEFVCSLEKPSGQRNPYCFDFSRYLKSRGIGAVAAIDSFSEGTGHFTVKEKYERWLYEKRCLFENQLSSGTKGIIMGVLFGETGFLDEDVYEDFRNNGTAHVLAVSGLHVGILYGIYKKIAGNRNSPAALVLLAVLLFTYGVLSMWSPSVIRAVLMIIMSVLARILDLRYDMLTAMSAVGLILIAANPYVIFGAGFQMSFLAITSIAFIQPVIPDRIPDFLATAMAVNIGLMMYQIYQFNYISLVSLAANIPVIFLAGYFVPVAIAAFCLFCAAGNYELIRPAVDGMAMVITWVNEFSTLDGYGAVEVVRPPLWCVLIGGGLIFFMASETFTVMKLRAQYKKIAACVLAICLGAGLCSVLTYCPVTDDDIVFVDVGQGDCIHIRDGNKDVLIDGGGSMNYNVGKNILKPYLLRNGAWNLDMALVTHEHMDHYKGIQELKEIFPVNRVIKRMTAGQNVTVSEDVYIETLWPETIDPEKGQDANDQCSAFMVHYKEYRILVTGDLDETGEKSMLKKYAGTDKLRADILKIGHHGSATSTCQEFLDAIKPSYAVIQVGKNNYGHPTPKVIEKLKNSCIIILRNDYNGAVGFSFDKEEINCHFMLE